MSDERSGFRLTTLHLFMMLPWIAIVVAARQPIRDNSFLWHVRAGDLQRSSGEVLTVDPFSFTFGGAQWRTQSWLVDLLYSWLHDISGLDFVPWLITVVALIAVAYVALATFHRSESLAATAFALALVAWVGASYLSPRPVLFSYALLAALASVLGRPRLRWTIPLIVWIWAAIHGSFVVGIGLIVLHRIARKRPLSADLAMSVVLASLTAHGIGIWTTLWRFFQNRPALELISEWAPPNLTSPDLVPYALVIALVIWGSATGAISKRDLIIVIPFLLFGLTAARSLFPALIVLVPFAASSVGDRWDSRLSTGGVHWTMKAVVAVFILGLPFLITPAWNGLSESRFPIEEAALLGPGNTFHDDVVGGYLIYAYPETAVFVDDRAELYGADHFRELVATRNARPEWSDVFEAHGISQALVSVDDGIVAVLELSGWRRVAEGESYVLLIEGS